MNSTEKLAGVMPGDLIFVGHRHEIPKPVQVEKVGKLHLTAGGARYAIRDGIKAGQGPRPNAYGYIKAQPYSDELQAAYNLSNLKWMFEKELMAFRADPARMTQNRLMELIRVMNPEAWK